MTARPAGPPRRRVVWAARAFAVVLSTIVGAVAAEVVLRSQPVAAPAGARAPDPEARGLPDIEGIFALARPNQRARYRGALYETNSRGVRGPEMTIAKPPGTFRIAVIGDSFTMGSGVRLEEAYPALLQDALNGTGAVHRYEVLNFGLSGLSLAGAIDQRLLPIALDYAPDLLVYGFTVNDLEGPDYASHPRLPRRSGRFLLLDLLHERWDYLRDLTWPSRSSYVRELDENYFANPAVWSRFESDLDRLAAIGRDKGICVVVLMHTQLTALHSLHPFERHYDAVARAAEARAMHVIRTFPWYRGVDPDGYTCGPFDSHPNDFGHQILAEALLSGVRSLSPRCMKQ